MKKIVVFVLAAVMSLGIFGTALAADVDLASMSTDELIALRNQIVDELTIRLGSGDAIYAGDYKGGVTIKSGTYTITCTKEKENASDDMVLGIFDEDDIYFTYKDSSAYYDFKENAPIYLELDKDFSGVITIEDGQHLVIKWGEAILTPAAPSWAP